MQAISTLPQKTLSGQPVDTGREGSVKTIRLISRLAAGLVAVLALLAFILSYSSLQHVAATHGVSGWLSYLWPLLLDFAMLVFSLAILRANLRGEPAWYPWILTGVFAGLATVANILDVTALGIPVVVIAASVKALAPVALVLAFELLMQMIKAEVKRAAVVAGMADLERRRQELAVELEQQQAETAAIVAGLTGQMNDLAGKRDELKAELDSLRREKRREADLPPDEPSPALVDRAREIIAERPEISGSELGRQLGKSESLGRRLRREVLAQAAPVAVNGRIPGPEVAL